MCVAHASTLLASSLAVVGVTSFNAAHFAVCSAHSLCKLLLPGCCVWIHDPTPAAALPVSAFNGTLIACLQENLDTADVLYYHAPSFSGEPRPKAFPNQLRLVMSLESAAYYAVLDDPKFMCQFDAEMTYRTCAQVTNWYSLEGFNKLFRVRAWLH